ncbi:MAG: M48 family metalloprotease [Acidimicrobiia bacterium]|nr:M48 family metalloprotease [Acidimicrobiia bacterium]
MRNSIKGVLFRSRLTSRLAPLLTISAAIVLITIQITQLHIISVIGTTLVSLLASILSYSCARYSTQRFIRGAVRARLAVKENQYINKMSRQLKGTQVQPYIPASTHPSKEIKSALNTAEGLLGLKQGVSMALVIPLDEFTGIDSSCPSAASLLYSGRHPVVVVDNNLQHILDDPKDREKAQSQVVAVLCHELAHLMGFNTRYSSITGIFEQFVITSSMAMLVSYGLEYHFSYGFIGAIILTAYMIFEPFNVPANPDQDHSSISSIISRVTLVSWYTYVISGLFISIWPVILPACALGFPLCLTILINAIRRTHEYYADKMAVLAMGSIRPLVDFFKNITTFEHKHFERFFATHPSTRDRITKLHKIKF